MEGIRHGDGPANPTVIDPAESDPILGAAFRQGFGFAGFMAEDLCQGGSPIQRPVKGHIVRPRSCPQADQGIAIGEVQKEITRVVEGDRGF